MAGKAGKKQLTLTQALSQFLTKTLLPDLKERAKHPAVNAALTRQWQAEKTAQRTADGFPAWETRTLEQVGAAWVLSCVFVRTLEDRALLGRRRIAGPGADDSEQLFFELAPSLTARDYLLMVFREVASLPGAEDLLGPRHNPAWRLSPSNEAARALLDFFRQQEGQGAGDAQEALVWRFDGDDTRFLGDLYQDVSEEVRKRYALLQTPDFVERFILDQTLEPALAEFGLQQVRVIDPTCGSGHFLLGAFDRLLAHRQRAAPAVDVRDHALAALAQVYGVDVNPYAVAIARFRLTLVYLQRTGITKLAQAPRLPLNLVVADSLLHGAKNTNVLFAEHESAAGDYEAWGAEMFALDDPRAARVVFGQRYHAVVGNPPYITCKDKALRDGYREFYTSCYREYALSAPFTERFFQLATDGGFVGLINANSFMKREFGKALIEKVLPHLDITRVVDTSGAFIPGHGTPTVILFGRNRRSVNAHVGAVLGKRGEPTTPEDAAQGLVWRSIVDHGQEVGFENDYVSVANVSRDTLQTHPWSLGGGGAADLKALLEDRAEQKLGDIVDLIGFGAVTREDDVFVLPTGGSRRFRIGSQAVAGYGFGEALRDWAIMESPPVLFPYDERGETLQPDALGDYFKVIWRYRTQLWLRQGKGFKTKKEQGGQFYEYSMFYPERYFAPRKIAFAFVATHNHFVLDRGGKVFNRSAPIIKLPESATEDDHLALLAYLNSSTAAFYFRQAGHSKGAQGVNEGHKSESWEQFLEYSGGLVGSVPLPPGLDRLVDLARRMEELVQRRADLSARHLVGKLSSTGEPLPDIDEWSAMLSGVIARQVAVQEEIDWLVYELFEIVQAGPPSSADPFPVTPGQRPFEVVLAKTFPSTRWFSSNHFTLPDPGVLGQRQLGRVGVIERDRSVATLEQPEVKRRWVIPDLKQDLSVACSDVLAEQAEEHMRSGTAPVSLRSIEAHMAQMGDRAETLLSCSGRSLAALIDSNSAPFVAALRFSEAGWLKQLQWRTTWDLQRREDLGEAVGDIPVPPKYDQKDYRDPSFWRLRGKLDVPKERFVSYPGCEKDGDPSPLIGWAGWNHLQRAQALVALYQERKNDDGWSRDRLMPMLVGLYELMFWLDLWHSQPQPGSQNPAREFKQFLDAELHTHALTTDDLEAWRPPTRKSPARRAAAKPLAADGDAREDAVRGGDDADTNPKRLRRRKSDVPVDTP